MNHQQLAAENAQLKKALAQRDKAMRDNRQALANTGLNVKSFAITAQNTNAAAQTTYLFDAFGLYTAITGNQSHADITEKSGGDTGIYDAIVESLKSSPIRVAGFNISTSGTQADFDNTFRIHKAEVDGRTSTIPIQPGMFKRNTQEQNTLLTIDQAFLLDGFTTLEAQVTNGVTLTFTFFVDNKYNRLI